MNRRNFFSAIAGAIGGTVAAFMPSKPDKDLDEDMIMDFCVNMQEHPQSIWIVQWGDEKNYLIMNKEDRERYKWFHLNFSSRAVNPPEKYGKSPIVSVLGDLKQEHKMRQTMIDAKFKV